jgi:hypothetical protein
VRLFLVIVVALLFAAGTAGAQTDQRNKTENKSQQKNYLYKWTDNKGVVHVADDLGLVPKQYRNKALKIEESTRGEEPAQEGRKITSTPSTGYDDEAEQEKKAYWQQRIKQARQRLADAQRRYQDLEQQRNAALMRWSGGASGNIALRLEADRLDQEMKNIQSQIDEARNEIENEIPEEARKAGVPPGWLRE